jgi:hypothetical protein
MADIYRERAATPPAVAVEPEEIEEPVAEDEGIDPSTAAVGAGVGLGAAALAAASRMPGAVGAVGKGMKALNSLRQQLMLSGLALPKSMLGNAGAVVEKSIEKGSTAPLKELFSQQTAADAAEAWKRGGVSDGIEGLDQAIGQSGNPVTRFFANFAPGRVMGAMDEATQGAMRRAGVSAKEAQAAVLQKPLPTPVAEALDNPIAKYFQPFRRTPINQVLEGSGKYTRFFAGEMGRGEKVALGVNHALGAAHGAATADEDVPVSLPLGIAFSGRGGLPYGLAAMIGRTAAGGDLPGSGIAGSLLPASEWGLESSVTDPTKPFKKPAALTALEKIGFR